MEYKLSEAALKDIRVITYRIAKDNESAARRVYQSILDTCATVADIPNIGHRPMYVEDQEILSVSVQKYKRYLVFYKKRSDDVLILRVIHSARDLPALFND